MGTSSPDLCVEQGTSLTEQAESQSCGSAFLPAAAQVGCRGCELATPSSHLGRVGGRWFQASM